MPLSFTMHDRISPAPPAVPAGDQVKFFGRDLRFELGGRGTEIGASGRYVLVEGLAALRQAVYHVLVTEPGAYRRFPRYGVGLLRFIGREITQANVDEIRSRTTEGLLQLRRVDSVRDVAIAQPDPYSIFAHVAIVAAGRNVRFQPFDFRREVI